MGIESFLTFTIDKTQSVEHSGSELAARAKEIKRTAMGHDDDAIVEGYFTAAANLADELRLIASELELAQIPAYHAITGSGMAPGATFEAPIGDETRVAVERSIETFLAEQEALLAAYKIAH
jgi:hypothetical protein